MRNRQYLMVLGGTVGATVLAGMACTIPRTVATSGAASTTTTVTVAASCSLTGTEVTPHADTIGAGQSKNGIGETSLKALCNDPSGFALYAVGYGQDTVGNTVLHSDAVGSSYDIATGTTTGGASQWSMQLSAVSGTYAPTIQNSFDSAHSVPSQYTKVAQFGAATDATVGSTVKTTYNAYVSTTQPAGTYTGKVKYVLVHPSGSAPSDNLVMQSVDVWKDTMLTGETYKVTDARDNKEYYVAKLDDGKIWMTQNLDLCVGCTGTTALNSTNTDINVSGSGAYATDYTTDGNGITTWTPTASTMTGTPATITNFASGNPENSVSGWSNTTVAPQMAEGSTEYMVQGTAYATRAACVEAHSAAICDHNHVGNYYNWTAAIASSASGSITSRYAVADNSICPKGWRLPKGPDGTNGSEFEQMLKVAQIANQSSDKTDPGVGDSSINVGYLNGGNLASTDMEKSPYFFARSGYVDGTTLYYFTGLGYYWSSSAVSGSQAFDLNYYSSELYPAARNYRFNGRGLRCVAR